MQNGSAVAAQGVAQQVGTGGAAHWKPLDRLLGLACLLLVLSGAGWLAWKAVPQLASEGHWLEWLQVALLLAAGVLHGRQGNFWSAAGLLRAGLGILALSFAIREVDIDKLGTAPAWAMREWMIRAANALLLAWWLRAAYRHRLALVRCLRGEVAQPWFWLALLTGFLYACSWPLDKDLVPLPQDLALFLEELLELEASAMLLLAALAMPRRRGTRSR